MWCCLSVILFVQFCFTAVIVGQDNYNVIESTIVCLRDLLLIFSLKGCAFILDKDFIIIRTIYDVKILFVSLEWILAIKILLLLLFLQFLFWLRIILLGECLLIRW